MVQATASMRRSSTPASTMARAITGLSSSRWARLAISGTTPPNGACSSICELTTLDSDVAAAHHQRRRRLVAARLDAEHERVGSDLVVVVDANAVDLRHRSSAHSSPRRRAYAGVWMSWHHITMASSVPS